MNKEQCEQENGTWVEKDGVWMCEHPAASDDSAEAAPAAEGSSEAM